MPTRRANRSAKEDRDRPASEVRSFSRQWRAGLAWIARSARAIGGSDSPPSQLGISVRAPSRLRRACTKSRRIMSSHAARAPGRLLRHSASSWAINHPIGVAEARSASISNRPGSSGSSKSAWASSKFTLPPRISVSAAAPTWPRVASSSNTNDASIGCNVGSLASTKGVPATMKQSPADNRREEPSARIQQDPERMTLNLTCVGENRSAHAPPAVKHTVHAALACTRPSTSDKGSAGASWTITTYFRMNEGRSSVRLTSEIGS